MLSRLFCLTLMIGFTAWLQEPASAQSAAETASPLQLPEQIEQAGLQWGRLPPGSRLQQDGKTVPLLDSGYFLMAVHQDASKDVRLRYTLPDGTTHSHTVTVLKRDWPVQRINGLPASKVSPPKEVLDRIAREGAEIAAMRRILIKEPYFTSGFVMPLEGRISGEFGGKRILNGIPKSPHRGLDVAAPTGTPIKAPADGVVTLVHQDMYYTGKTVGIDHGYGLSSIMIHMSDIAVEKGQLIKQGEIIGDVGMTGRSTGPHLHWGVFLGNTAVDPKAVLNILHK